MNGHLPANQITNFIFYYDQYRVIKEKNGGVRFIWLHILLVHTAWYTSNRGQMCQWWPIPARFWITAGPSPQHRHTHSSVYIHHNLNRYTMTHTLRPNLCHIPHPVWHSLNLSLGLSNDGLQGQRDEQIIWLKWGIAVSVEIRLTGKCPRCYVLDNEYAEGGETPGSWHRFISPHSDGLIPVRATATQCPSTELKIVTEAKNSWELCSLEAALTWTHTTKLHHHALGSFSYIEQCIENCKNDQAIHQQPQYVFWKKWLWFLPSNTQLTQT